MNDAIFTNDIPLPGQFIKEELEARGWSQRDLAFILGTPEQAVNMIVSGKRGISPEMAKALGNAFGVHADLFANLQKAYDMARAREPDPGIARRARLQSSYPVREMIKRGWLQDGDAAMLEMQMTRFFGGDIPHLEHRAKKTDYYEEIPPAQLAWLFRVKQIAEAMPVPRYSEKTLLEAMPRLRVLAVEPEEVRHVPRILSECGIRFVIVESLPNGKIDGVCLWLDSNSPVVGLSLRHDRIDNFWFVLRHELEHVLQRDGQPTRGHNGGPPMLDVELEGDRASATSETVRKEERIANAAAAVFTLPQAEIESFIARKNPFFSERDIVGFARRLQVHPGIVVGQIQSRTGRWELLRKYLVKIRHLVIPSAIVDGWGQVAPVSV